MNKELKVIKVLKTKLLNTKCKTSEDFEEIQNKLNEIEIEEKIERGEII